MKVLCSPVYTQQMKRVAVKNFRAPKASVIASPGAATTRGSHFRTYCRPNKDRDSPDMTRSWYTLTEKVDPDNLEDLKRLEAKHSVKQD